MSDENIARLEDKLFLSDLRLQFANSLMASNPNRWILVWRLLGTKIVLSGNNWEEEFTAGNETYIPFCLGDATTMTIGNVKVDLTDLKNYENYVVFPKGDAKIPFEVGASLRFVETDGFIITKVSALIVSEILRTLVK